MSAGICEDCYRAVDAHHPGYWLKVEERDEAQGKLAAVDEWQEDWDGLGTIDWTALSRILKGE